MGLPFFLLGRALKYLIQCGEEVNTNISFSLIAMCNSEQEYKLPLASCIYIAVDGNQ